MNKKELIKRMGRHIQRVAPHYGHQVNKGPQFGFPVTEIENTSRFWAQLQGKNYHLKVLKAKKLPLGAWSGYEELEIGLVLAVMAQVARDKEMAMENLAFCAAVVLRMMDEMEMEVV